MLIRISQKMGFWGGLTVDWLCLCYANVQEALKDFYVPWPFLKFIRQMISYFISSHLFLCEYFEAWGIHIWRAFQWRPGRWGSLKILRSLWGKLGMQERDRMQRLANCHFWHLQRGMCVSCWMGQPELRSSQTNAPTAPQQGCSVWHKMCRRVAMIKRWKRLRGHF